MKARAVKDLLGREIFCIFTIACSSCSQLVFFSLLKERKKKGHRDSLVTDNSLLFVVLFSGCSKDAKRSCQAVDRPGFKSYNSQR